MTDREKTEALCLKETELALGSRELQAKAGIRVQRIYLDGEHPDTRVVAEGEHRDGVSWRVALPIWDPSTGATRDGQPLTGLFGTLMLAEVLEA